jgi:hypothetical protein
MFLEWEKKGWFFIENTEDEILSAVKEMVDFLFNERSMDLQKIQKSQHSFLKNFSNLLILKQIDDKKTRSCISLSFLEKHADLLI